MRYELYKENAINIYSFIRFGIESCYATEFICGNVLYVSSAKVTVLDEANRVTVPGRLVTSRDRFVINACDVRDAYSALERIGYPELSPARVQMKVPKESKILFRFLCWIHFYQLLDD